MKPSDSVTLMEGGGRNSELPRNNNFNHTHQAGYSAEKVYPNRSHTLDDNEILMSPRPGAFDNASNPMSPVRQRPDYITEGESSTADMTRATKYQSSTKMRLSKQQASNVEAHGMSATIHTSADHEALPNVKGAIRTKRTAH